MIAVGIAFVLRVRGGGNSGSGAAQGDLFTEGYEPANPEHRDSRPPARRVTTSPPGMPVR